MTIGPIGRVISRQNVEQAVLAVLKAEIGTYLTEVENQNTLAAGALRRPPADESFYGGADDQSWREDQLPALIVVAEPMTEFYRSGSGEYHWWFEITVNSVVLGDDEDSARALADWYAAAVMTLMMQSGDISNFAADVMLTDPGRAELVDEDRREFALTATTFKALISSVVNESLSPAPVYQVGSGDLGLVVTAVPDLQPLS